MRCVSPATSAGRRVWAFRTRRFPVAGTHRGGHLDAVALQDVQRIGAGAGVGTVGPLAITLTSSPGTSLMVSVTTRAGAQARPGARP
jgi:hypothetical protein